MISSSSSSSEYPYGNNIVVNGDFNGNASGWSLSGGIKYESFNIAAEQSGSYVKKASQRIPIEVDKSYLVKYELNMTGNATSSLSLGGTYVSYDNSQGILSSVIKCSDIEALIINVVVQSGKVYIANVSVQELLLESSSSSTSSISSQSSQSSTSTTKELLTSSTQSSFSSGENLVINGDFNGNADGWSLFSGMEYDEVNNYRLVAKKPPYGAPQASQKLPIEIGKLYVVRYEFKRQYEESTSHFSLGGVTIYFGNESMVKVSDEYRIDSKGILSATIKAENTDQLSIYALTRYGESYISNVSVQELPPESSSMSSDSSSSSSSTSSQSTSSDNSSISSLSTSSSSISSISSQSSSSTSSQSSSSTSSISSRSSWSTSSSAILTTSSSQSSQSSNSSSSSIQKGCYLVPFNFEATSGKQIWCFERNEQYVYAGTGPFGKIIRSSNYYKWDDFQTVDDKHVKSMILWSNALFFGTQPNGKIYTYNFSTDRFYEFVQTEDECVSCFCSFGDNLYAGTSPRGVVYVFDGIKWSKIFQACGGINSMSVLGDSMYALVDKLETAIKYDGNQWVVMDVKETINESLYSSSSSEPVLSESSSSVSSMSSESSSLSQSVETQSQAETGGQAGQSGKEREGIKETFFSFRNNSLEPISNKTNNFINRSLIGDIREKIANGTFVASDYNLIVPLIGIKNMLSLASTGSALYMGSDNGIIFRYPNKDGNAEILHQIEGKKVTNIATMNNGVVLVSFQNQLYLVDSQ
jgi:hypothetical protein